MKMSKNISGGIEGEHWAIMVNRGLVHFRYDLVDCELEFETNFFQVSVARGKNMKTLKNNLKEQFQNRCFAKC